MNANAASSTRNPRPDLITESFIRMLTSAGVVEAWLFGSVSRGEERPESDLDILVTFDHEIFLFDRMDLAERLTRLTGRNVDLLTNIHPFFEPYIRPTLVPIPL